VWRDGKTYCTNLVTGSVESKQGGLSGASIVAAQSGFVPVAEFASLSRIGCAMPSAATAPQAWGHHTHIGIDSFFVSRIVN